MELGYNHPMGPLKLTDLVGLDVRLNIAEYLHHELGSETFRPPELCVEWLVKESWERKLDKGFTTGPKTEETEATRICHKA
jgi:3-hydroxybutyryl-CoA dehydrogenase